MNFPFQYLAIMSTLFLSACMYDPVIHQGKAIRDSDLQKLHLHMTQQEVSGLLGTPFIQSNQKPNQWRYIESENQQHKQTVHEVILSFKHNKLIKIEKKTRQHKL